MCGLTGIFHYREQDAVVDQGALERATRRLAHRGPDGEGFHVEPGLGLGHRRLAVLELSDHAAQPMHDESGGVLVYNGQIYDHEARRPALRQRGARFRGRSDVETMLELLRLEGPRSLASVAGAFALAYWNPSRRILTLARDPLGVKQLYVHDDGRRVVFASEIKALFEYSGIVPELHPDGLNEYLHLHTPLFERTFFRNVYQVRPGELVEIGERGTWKSVYFQWEGTAPLAATPEEATEVLEQALRKVVESHLVGDVPIGAFLSGGVDSSLVAALAAETGRRIPLFGVHFSNTEVTDERPFQEAVANHLNLPLELTTYDDRNFEQDMRRLLYIQDSPVIGSAMLPLQALAELASRKVKVCLGGQGGDEVFGGYARLALVAPWLLTRDLSTGLGTQRSTKGVRASHLWKQLDRENLLRLARAVAHPGDYPTRYLEHMTRVPSGAWRAHFEDRSWVDRQTLATTFKKFLADSVAEDPVAKILHWEQATYLPGLFHQEDRITMAYGLESRAPLADPRIVLLAPKIPSAWKLRGGSTKWLLRKVAQRKLPEAVASRRKVGFDTPLKTWLRGTHQDFVRETLLGKRARTRGFMKPSSITQLLERPNEPCSLERLWKLLCLELWAQVYLDGGYRNMTSR